MDIGHIAQLANDRLGPAKVKYHLDLTRPNGGSNLKVDELGAGNFEFFNIGPANSNPTHTLTPGGLTLSVERLVSTAGNSGHFAGAATSDVALPDQFLLIATYERPAQVSLNANPPSGTYAPASLMNIGNGAVMGISCQFRPEGLRMNLPGTGAMANRPPISQALAEQILDASRPAAFTLALAVKRSATGDVGKGFFFVRNDEADSFEFTFTNLPPSSGILDLRAGIGTANGVNYRASVTLLDFQIWGPKR